MTKEQLEHLRILLITAKHELRKDYSPSLDRAIDYADARLYEWNKKERT